MKTYKDFEKIRIGESDIANLIMVGCREDQGAVTELLHFGEDGDYEAYYVTEPCEIGEHYKKLHLSKPGLKFMMIRKEHLARVEISTYIELVILGA